MNSEISERFDEIEKQVIALTDEIIKQLNIEYLRSHMYRLFFISSLTFLFDSVQGGLYSTNADVKEQYIKAWRKHFKAGINDGINIYHNSKHSPMFETEELRIIATNIRKDIDNMIDIFFKEKE